MRDASRIALSCGWAIVAALASAAPSRAQQPPPVSPNRTPPTAVGRVRGVVYDSLSRGGLAGARVWILRTDRSAVANGSGRFEMDSVPAGTWVVAAEHPALDSAGLFNISARVNVVAGRTSQVTLAAPSLRTIAMAGCDRSAAPASRDSGVVFGTVMDAESGVRLAGAQVSLWWLAVERTPLGPTVIRPERRVLSDSLGNYYACGIPRDVAIRARVRAGEFTSGEVDLVVPERRVFRQDLWMSRDSLNQIVDTASGLLSGLATLVGTVRSEDGAPLASAEAGVEGASGEAVTDAEGRFVLAGLPSGSRMLEVRFVGYKFAREPVGLRSRDTTRVSITLESITLLEAVRITATPWVRDELEQLERRLHGATWGYAIPAEDLRALGDIRTAFQGLPSLNVQSDARGFSLLTMVNGRFCPVSMWVDGWLSTVDILKAYHPSDFIAIEWFPRNTAPMRYKSLGDQCGVVLAWTRYVW